MRSCLFVISRAPSAIAKSVVCAFEPRQDSQANAPASGPLGLDIARCRELEDALAKALAERGARVLLLPHAYHLAPSHAAVARLADTDDDLVVASWLHPRPAFWTLRALGVEGEPTAQGCACCRPRTILCVDLRKFESADACVDALARLIPDSDRGSVEEIPDKAQPRWYPVLDYSRCVNCKQCHEFCMFGVYSLVDDKVVATQPDNCKPGCPACARVCPKGAIMFPHYLNDPGIAGAPGVEVAGKKIDVDAFFDAKPQAAGKPCACEQDRDDLDDLMDELEKLDE